MKKVWISAVLTLIFIASHSAAAQEASGAEELPQAQEAVQDDSEPVSPGSEPTGNMAASTVEMITAPPLPPPGSADRGNTAVNSQDDTGSIRIVLPPSAESRVLTINREPNGDFEVFLDPPSGASTVRSVPANPGSSRQAVRPAPTVGVRRPVPVLPAKVIPRMPAANDRKYYTVQVGAFASMSGANRVFRTVSDAGFRPAHERFGAYNRVIIPNVPAADIPFLARQLGAAGIKEVWIRE